MTEYIYPALFHENSDGSYTVTFPDLLGCITEGKTQGTALRMAQSALTQWIEYLSENGESLPLASAPQSIETGANEFVNLVCADVRDNHAVKRTVSIPKWLDDRASEAGLSLSRILQGALKEKLNV